MGPGQLVRAILGPRLFKPVGELYRSMFVDLERVVESFPPLPRDAWLLDIGGGMANC
jgi:hypothetical protein